MGCFSFLCKKYDEAVLSSSFSGDAVYLFLLKDGKVIEEMYGNYDSYGRVFDSSGESFEWGLDWGDVCDLMFDGDEGSGIAAILAKNYDGTPPTTKSKDDPNQGWDGESTDKKVKEPYHNIY